METRTKLLFPSTRAAKHCPDCNSFDAGHFFIFIFFSNSTVFEAYTATSICALKIPFVLFYLELFLQAEAVQVIVHVILVPRNSIRECGRDNISQYASAWPHTVTPAVHRLPRSSSLITVELLSILIRLQQLFLHVNYIDRFYNFSISFQPNLLCY